MADQLKVKIDTRAGRASLVYGRPFVGGIYDLEVETDGNADTTRLVRIYRFDVARRIKWALAEAKGGGKFYLDSEDFRRAFQTVAPSRALPCEFIVYDDDAIVAQGNVVIEWSPTLTTVDGKPVDVQGPPGPKGDKGEQGPKGDDGKSAYQGAVEQGYQGTEKEFYASLCSLNDLVEAAATSARAAAVSAETAAAETLVGAQQLTDTVTARKAAEEAARRAEEAAAETSDVSETVCTCAKAAASSAEAAASSARLASAQALDAVGAANGASASAKSAAQSSEQAAADGVAAAKSAQAAQASESAAGQSAAQAAAQASGAARSATQANASAQAAASSATAASQSAAQAGRALADAQAARDAAKASETATAGSAKDAAASATQAQEAKAGAEGAKSGAEAAKAGAETARDAAAKSATQAAQSADEAEAAKASLEEALAWSGKMRFRESCLRSLGYANGVAALQERDAKSDQDQQFLHGDGQNYLFQGSGKLYLLDKDLKLVKDLTGLPTPFLSHEGMTYFPYFVVRDGRLIYQSWSGDTIYVYDVETKAQIARLSTGYSSQSAILYNDRTGHLLVHKSSAAAGTVVTAMDVYDADLNIIGEVEAPEAIAPLCDKNGWPRHFAQHINGHTYVAFNKRADVTGTPLYILGEDDVPKPLLDADGETVMMYADRTLGTTTGLYGCWYPGFYTDNTTFVGADGTRKTRWLMTDGVMKWKGETEDEHGEIVWSKSGDYRGTINALGKRHFRPWLCSGNGGEHPNGVYNFPQVVIRYDFEVYAFANNTGSYSPLIVAYSRNQGGTVPVPESKLTVINTSGYQTVSPVLIYC